MKRRGLEALILMIILAAVAMPAAAKTDTGFVDRTVRIGKEVYRYQVFVPEGWNKSRKWPVILFLHGAGERGDDGLQQTQVGIATAIRWHRDRFPAVVVMPQCRKSLWWPEATMLEMALKSLDQSMKEFKGDPARVYLTGLSMGGYGTWAIASKFPGRFAALVPICGGVQAPRNLPSLSASSGGVDPYAEVAKKIGRTPVWIFHGAADTTVPPVESRRMNDALKAAGGNVRYDEYPGVGHNSWDKAYAEEELIKWLLSQHQ